MTGAGDHHGLVTLEDTEDQIDELTSKRHCPIRIPDFGQVESGTEHALATREHHCCGLVLLGLVELLVQAGQGGGADGVDLPFIQGEVGHAVVESVVAHSCIRSSED